MGLATSFLSFVEGSVFLRALVSAIAVFIVASLGSLIEIYIERKLWARIMSRYGPTEVGRYGSLQLFADAIKLVVKEDFTPLGADKPLYNAVPVIGVATTFVALMVIPFDYTLSLLFPKSLNPQLLFFRTLSRLFWWPSRSLRLNPYSFFLVDGLVGVSTRLWADLGRPLS
ncbi:hypothetical protein B9P99_05890 [Candidatus Marsarchaeota G1 archaeon OSP_B]|uniref:NADH-quinone oxidoreductase subunit H n=1 Tax=Candidatus Marsarchaeota G1 archaeon OSP_B TaxID=1978153 RepID=A0A2R6AQ17_9ARCH|nr:MAG: hypothetical protein B9P99_05890 [Candidatus Marsarchaeota G1 archaeon OSP_B]